MNGLSWLLYAAEVSGNAQIAAGIALTIAGLVAVFGTIGLAVGGEWGVADLWNKFYSRLIPIAVVCLVLLVVVPGRNTIMLIAASEVGEDVLNSDSAKQIGGEAGEIAVDSLKLLRKYLDEQLGETKPE